MNLLRSGRHALRLAVAIFALVVVTPTVAAAGPSPEVLASAEVDAFGFDDTDTDVAKVRLHCRNAHADVPTIGCTWRSDAAVATWQLWNLQTAPTEGSRNLVAELGADVSSYADTAVNAPGAYLYVVLGLDEEGEIIARSRPDKARIADPDVQPIDLSCEIVRSDVDDDAAEDVVEPDPVVVCGWSTDAEVASYALYRRTGRGEREVIATLGADATRYTDTDVACGTRYAYRIVGLDADGERVARSRIDVAGCRHDRKDDRAEARAERAEERAAAAGAGETDGEDKVRGRRGHHDKDQGDDVDASDADTSDVLATTADVDAETEDHDGRNDRPAPDRRDRRGRGR